MDVHITRAPLPPASKQDSCRVVTVPLRSASCLQHAMELDRKLSSAKNELRMSRTKADDVQGFCNTLLTENQDLLESCNRAESENRELKVCSAVPSTLHGNCAPQSVRAGLLAPLAPQPGPLCLRLGDVEGGNTARAGDTEWRH